MRRSTTSIGEITFAGIDYHKRFIVVALGDRGGNLIRHDKIFNDEMAIRNYFSLLPGIVCAIETCRGFEWLLDLLQELNIEVRVCHARMLKLIALSSIKTDKVDSTVIMRLLAKDILPVVQFPTRQQQELKEQLRWRVHLMRTQTRIKLRIHALIDKENKGFAGKDLFSRDGRRHLERLSLSPARRLLLDKQLELLDEIQIRLNVEYKWIKQLVDSDDRVKLLLTIPGVGYITAATLVAEIGDVTRFKRAEQLAKYFGLVCSERSSGDVESRGRITKEGNSHVRWLLVEDAWQAIHKSPALNRIFMRISIRRGKHGKKIAVVAIARRLIEIAYNVLRRGQPYSEDRVALGQRVASRDAESVVS